MGFIHWPIPARSLAKRLPPGIELDTRDGSAWVSLVFFAVTAHRIRGRVPVPGAFRFRQANLRTYVTHRGEPGVFFLRLYVTNALMALTGRALNLPYRRAAITLTGSPPGVEFAVAGLGGGLVRPTGPAAPPEPGSLAAWLTERRLLFVPGRWGGIWQGTVLHPPWPLRPGTGELAVPSLPAAAGLTGAAAPAEVAGRPGIAHPPGSAGLLGPPLMHLMDGMHARIGPLLPA